MIGTEGKNMSLELFHVNAFVKNNELFSGNPAAVCPLNEFLPDDIMQKIAAQNNLAETAFIVFNEDNCLIRWFAPKEEVDLCGHATLAAAYVIFNFLAPNMNNISFQSKKYQLQAKRSQDFIELDFPARPYEKIKTPALITEALSFEPMFTLASDDYLVVLNNQDQIQHLKVDSNKLAQLDRRGVVFTARGIEADFVSRVFHPKLGIGEDPVCGSAHCELTPYWSAELNKNSLRAFQLSDRGGEIFCDLKSDRVFLKGKCLMYLKGIYTIK